MPSPRALAVLLLCLLPLPLPAEAQVVPPNDDCQTAPPIGFGNLSRDTFGATNDGAAACERFTSSGGDVWYSFTASANGPVTFRVAGEEHRVSVHNGCPATSLNQFGCGEAVLIDAEAGQEYLVRVSNDGEGESFDLEIVPGATISGRVQTLSGDPLAEVEVSLRDLVNGGTSAQTLSDTEGRYTLPVLFPGTYSVNLFDDPVDGPYPYQPEIYDDIPCRTNNCSAAGDPLVVAEEEQVTGIDFQLDRYATISGKVTDASTGQPLANIGIGASPVSGGRNYSSRTDESGRYEIEGVPNEEYIISASGTGYRREVYDDVPCVSGSCRDEAMILIPPLNSALESVDFELDALASLSGRVRNQETGEPIPYILVRLRNEAGQERSSETDSGGRYFFGGLEEGTYYLWARSPVEDYFSEVYPEMPCPPEGCDPTSGTPISIGFNQTLTNRNFELEKAPRVTGQVRSAVTGEPVVMNDFASRTRVALHLDDENNTYFTLQSTDDEGRYSLPQPPSGAFVLVALPPSPFFDEVWNGHPCLPGCDLDLGDRIQSSFQDLVGFDFEVERQGMLTGQVTDARTGEPLAGARIEAYPSDDIILLVATDSTNAEGHFALDLQPGTYRLIARKSGYQGEIYEEVPCSQGFAECGLGMAIPLEGINQVVSGLDFTLEPLPTPPSGAMAGSVRDAQGTPVFGARVRIFEDSGTQVRSVSSDASGVFGVGPLAPGSYFAVIDDPPEGLEGQIFRNRPCTPSACNPLSGTPIRIVADRTTQNINFSLPLTPTPPAGTLRGQISDSVLGAPILGARVRLSDAEGNFVRSAFAEGAYVLDDIPPGDYFVSTSSPTGYFDQVHPGISCFGLCNPMAGTPVRIGVDTVTTLDFTLAPQQGFLGRLTQKGTGLPIPRANVTLWPADGGNEISVSTQPDGRFLVIAPQGDYRLSVGKFDAVTYFPFLLYPDAPCFFDCDPFFAQNQAGTLVRQVGNTFHEGFDFELEGDFCTNEFTNGRCLQGDRFHAILFSNPPDGSFTPGNAFPITDDTSAFYLFNPDNLEVVVKVIDACAPPFNHFWVFAAGLTNQQIGLTVQDTWTGESNFYENPHSTPFQLIRDTRAFATCDVGAGLEFPSEPQDDLENLLEQVQEFERTTAGGDLPEPVAAEKTPGNCVSDDTHLCVADGRFRIEGSWATPDGESGPARAEALTEDTGYFWFFGRNNVEILVKVIDACTLDGFNTFWVFAAGLTDVEVTLRVTDTLSGEVKEYFNPLGSAFAPVQDTRAFATCP